MSTKYKKYLQNPDVPVPKTTAWRYKKREGTNASTNEESQNSKKRMRRAYVTDSTRPIPRQTVWYWNKKESKLFSFCVTCLI